MRFEHIDVTDARSIEFVDKLMKLDIKLKFLNFSFFKYDFSFQCDMCVNLGLQDDHFYITRYHNIDYSKDYLTNTKLDKTELLIFINDLRIMETKDFFNKYNFKPYSDIDLEEPIKKDIKITGDTSLKEIATEVYYCEKKVLLEKFNKIKYIYLREKDTMGDNIKDQTTFIKHLFRIFRAYKQNNLKKEKNYFGNEAIKIADMISEKTKSQKVKNDMYHYKNNIWGKYDSIY